MSGVSRSGVSTRRRFSIQTALRSTQVLASVMARCWAIALRTARTAWRVSRGGRSRRGRNCRIWASAYATSRVVRRTSVSACTWPRSRRTSPASSRVRFAASSSPSKNRSACPRRRRSSSVCVRSGRSPRSTDSAARVRISSRNGLGHCRRRSATARRDTTIGSAQWWRRDHSAATWASAVLLPLPGRPVRTTLPHRRRLHSRSCTSLSLAPGWDTSTAASIAGNGIGGTGRPMAVRSMLSPRC